MSIESISIDGGDTSSLEEWLKSQEAGKLHRDLEERILNLLFSCSPSDFQFQRIIEQFARIGTKAKDRSLLERDIAQISSSFSAIEIELSQQSIFPPLPKLELPSSLTELLVTSEGISEPMESKIPKGPFASPARDPDDPRNVISRKFILEGTKTSASHIVWINGINNTFEESRASGAYIQSLVDGHAISGIYNCSHTPVVDLVEAGLLNHNGFSPITANLLKSEWQAFHEANANRPNAKLLQICHSQGAIDVRNALRNSSQEIRDRVIVVAIAPGAIVPKRLCFKSFNYASENDIVYKLEPPPPPPVVALTIDDVIIPTFGEAIDDRNELIILLPHSGANGIDHEFISPTYQPYLKKLLENYEQHQGEFPPEGKESLG